MINNLIKGREKMVIVHFLYLILWIRRHDLDYSNKCKVMKTMGYRIRKSKKDAKKILD